jgi:acyl carrier protein
MIPSAFVMLDGLPLTPNGKVDRKALPAPDTVRPALRGFVAPRTPTEKLIAAIWSGVLNVDEVGVHDNFFDLGGHSLSATQVLSRLKNTLHLEIPLRMLFDHPTVGGMGEQIEDALPDAVD